MKFEELYVGARIVADASHLKNRWPPIWVVEKLHAHDFPQSVDIRLVSNGAVTGGAQPGYCVHNQPFQDWWLFSRNPDDPHGR